MRETERNRLWEQYHKKKTPQLREQLILEYAGVVNLVAGRLSMYLGYTVEYDDLVGYGIFGLIDAIDKYDMAKNVKFETYASLRIRGAILDEIRKMDWIPRAGIEGNASGSPQKTDRKRAECHHIILLRRIDIKRD